MPPSPEQLNILWNLSDDTLYPEAVDFIHRLVEKEDCMPLPASQVMGLLNIANAASYAELERFIKHQCERNWPESKKDIKFFYTELGNVFTSFRNKRLRTLFHLEAATGPVGQQEIDALMLLVARDFIQHLITENSLLANQRARRR